MRPTASESTSRPQTAGTLFLTENGGHDQKTSNTTFCLIPPRNKIRQKGGEQDVKRVQKVLVPAAGKQHGTSIKRKACKKLHSCKRKMHVLQGSISDNELPVSRKAQISLCRKSQMHKLRLILSPPFRAGFFLLARNRPKKKKDVPSMGAA